jgi:hypothetical protein
MNIMLICFSPRKILAYFLVQSCECVLLCSNRFHEAKEKKEINLTFFAIGAFILLERIKKTKICVLLLQTVEKARNRQRGVSWR